MASGKWGNRRHPTSNVGCGSKRYRPHLQANTLYVALLALTFSAGVRSNDLSVYFGQTKHINAGQSEQYEFVSSRGLLHINGTLATEVADARDNGILILSNGGTLTAFRVRIFSSGRVYIGAREGENAVAAGFIQTDINTLIDSDSQLIFNHSSQGYQYTSRIEGNGTLHHLEGDTTLTANNSNFTGRISIEGGTLTIANQLGGGSANLDLDGGTLRISSTAFNHTWRPLNIGSNGGTLDIVSPDNIFSLAGTLSGAGDFNLTGPGMLLLSSDSSAFSGSTQVNTGSSLVVNGSLGGDLYLAAGSYLGGIGTLGSIGRSVTIASGATHAPGNSIGTQYIAGDYINHGTLQIEATPAAADQLVVSGAVDISGATLELLLSPDNPTAWSLLNGPFVIIDKQSAGDVIGTFAQVTPNLLFLEGHVDYAGGDGNDVTLTLERNTLAFQDIAETRNQRATSASLDNLEQSSPVWRAIASASDAGSTRQTYDALSGEIHASAKTALIEDSRFIRSAAIDRLRSTFDATAAAESASSNDSDLWSQAIGSWGNSDGDGNAAALDRNSKGLLLGADRALGDWRIGAMAGIGRSDIKASARHASVTVDSYHFGLYGGTQFDRLNVRTGAAYSWHRLDSSRSVQLPGLSEKVESRYDAGTFQVFGELGYAFDSGSTRLEPFANLAHVSLATRGASESGGNAALHSDKDSMDAQFTTLGLRAEHNLTLAAVELTLSGSLGWRHAFGETLPESRHWLGNYSPFSVAGVPIARNSTVLDAGLTARLGSHSEVRVAYTGQHASHAHDHGFNLHVTTRF